VYQRAEDPEFLELVGRDVRGKSTPEEHAFLRSPEGMQLWRDGLKAIRMDLETQSIHRKADAEAFRTACVKKGPSGKQEWFEYKASWDAWKAGAARFKRSVETNLAEAKRLAQEQQQHSEKERFRQLLVETLNFLNQDEAITYKYVPTRDDLREKISSVLYKNT
jgi:Trypanosomal VSG domain